MNIFALILAMAGAVGAVSAGGSSKGATLRSDDSKRDELVPVIDDEDDQGVSDTPDMDDDGHNHADDEAPVMDDDDGHNHTDDEAPVMDDDDGHNHADDDAPVMDDDDGHNHADDDADSAQQDGTPIVLILGQSNASNLSSSNSLINAVTDSGVDAIQVNVSGGGESVSRADGAWNLVQGDGEDAQGASYVRLLETMAQIFEETPDAYIANAVWVQGEADAHGVNALNYYDAASELFTQLRTDLGDDFPISIVGLTEYQNLGDVGRTNVTNAHLQLAEDFDDVYFVDTNAIITENNFDEEFVLADNLHYTPEFFDHIAEAILDEPAVQSALGLNHSDTHDHADDDMDDSHDNSGHDHADDSTDDTDNSPDHGHDGDDMTDMDDGSGHDHNHGDGGSGVSDMPRATAEEIEAFVAAVKAAPEAHAHGDDEALMMEHTAALDLVARDEATHIAVRNGDWSDPDTWYNGEIPDDDARVLIPEGIHVDYATVSEARLFTLRVDGELEFATDTDSTLIVDTIVTSPTSVLTIGTEEEPVEADVNIDIIFANNGPIDVDWDPMLLSRGIISHGEVSIHGTEKDSHEKVIDDPMAGDTFVEFDEVPTGWAVGDTIVIAGTHYEGYTPDGEYVPSEDEVRVISSIDGDTVHFDTALEFDHDTPRDDLKTSVANYTRNVSFETENAELAEVAERGHVMFMHNDDVEVRYAEFHELGRTDKSDDAFAASEFDEIASDSNVQGRYAVHIHRAGTETDDYPAVLEGNAVFG